MELIESFVLGKHAAAERCEDMLVLGPRIAAAIDGVSDKSGRLFTAGDGTQMTGGRLVAGLIAGALGELSAGTAPLEAVAVVSAAVADGLDGQEWGAYGPPGASVVVFDAELLRIWRVGDCQVRIGGVGQAPQVHAETKAIDELTTAIRLAYLHSVTAELGRAPEPQDEAGAVAAMLPLLTRQWHLANRPGPYGYGVIDGRPVPEAFIDVFDVPAGAEVVLATDGYPRMPATLAEAEAELTRLLAEDPACTGKLATTKRLLPGQHSFDDRAWVRVRAT